MKPLTELCFEELEFAGGQALEIADRLSEDVDRVAKALCKLSVAKRIDYKILDAERRVYFYFIPKPKAAAKPSTPTENSRAARKAGHVYFRQFQMRWG